MQIQGPGGVDRVAHPGCVDAERLKNTANEHVQAGRLEEGQRLYSQALSRLETAPNTSEVYTRLWTAVKLNTARVHMMREHWVAAAECCDQVIANKRSMAAPPSRHKAYYRRGVSRLELAELAIQHGLCGRRWLFARC
jgi:hypothetical protein